MIWTDDKSDIKTFESKTTNETELEKEFLTLLSHLLHDNFLDTKQILIYVDATNGNLFISGYNTNIKEAIDGKGIFVALNELWEDNQNAGDFDEIVFSSLKKALNTDSLKAFKDRFELYFQTEVDNEPKRL